MKKLLLITLMLVFGLIGFPQTNESQNSGNWNVDGNWTLGHEPLASEDVVIKPGHAITVQSATNAVAYTVVVEGTASLDILGTFTLAVPTVYNTTTLETWMDRNLGASQVAITKFDAAAKGDLYQWGRATEGHEDRGSGTTSTNATTAVPSDGNTWDGKFIKEPDDPKDWLETKDDNLWQGVSGINNPCPAGFRLPTIEEWEAERLTWASNDWDGAFGSPLKLVYAGHRTFDNAGIYLGGDYWSSTTIDVYAKTLHFSSSVAHTTGNSFRANGYSVRCIKE